MAHLIQLLQWLSVGLAVLSAALWVWSAKVPLNLEYSTDEPFVLELKVLRARAEQLTNDAAIKAAFTSQSSLSAAAAVCAFLSACLQVSALYLQS
jgi:hypothetical protein